MDYDDNDFHSQNLHLAGEGNSKFPPVLRPYALPKFDFDESLQGHLRFDSLAETEGFLGIESNEDNQWIEAYSRGSSGIEFSSTAAESCSISRHNNVWSEATSSESVEMLLKSVGQEDFIPSEAVLQESGACDELACLAKQMEPNIKPDKESEFKDNVTDLQPSSCIQENLSVSKEDVEREQSLAGVSQGHECELSIDGSLSNVKPTDLQPASYIHENLSGSKEDVEMDQSPTGVFQGHEGEVSIDGSLSKLTPHDMHINFDLPASRGVLFTDVRSDNTSQKVVTVADDHLDEKIQVDSSASGMTTNFIAASTQKISSSCDVLNIQNVENQVVCMGDEEQSSVQMQTNKQDLGSSMIYTDSDVDAQTLNVNAVGGETHHSDKPQCSIPMEDAFENGSVAEEGLESGVSGLEDSLNMVSGGISDLQKADRCNEDTYSRASYQSNANEDVISIKDAVTVDQSALNTSDLPKVAIKDDSSSEGHRVELSNPDCGTCLNFKESLVSLEKTYDDTYSRASYRGNANEDVVSIKDAVMVDQSALNTSDLPKTAIKDDSSSEGHQVELSKPDCGSCPNFQLNVVSLEKTYDDAYSRASYQGNGNEDVISIKDAVMVDQSAVNTSDLPKVAIKDDSSSEGHQVELSNPDCGTSPNFQQNVVSLEKTHDDGSASKEKELSNIGNQMGSEVLFSKSEASIFPVAGNNASTVSEGYSGSDAGGIFSSDKADSTKSCILGEAIQVCENNKPDEQDDHKIFCEDDSVSGQESIKAPSDSSPIRCNVDQSHIVDGGVGASPLGDSLETKLTTSTVSVDVMPINSSASQSILENTSSTSTSCEIVDIPPPSSRVVSTHEVTVDYESQRMKLDGSASVDEKEDSEAKIAEEAGNSSASQVILENISSTSTSCEIVDIPPPSSRIVSTHEVTVDYEIQRMKLDGSASVDEKEESEAKMAEETSISVPIQSPEQDIVTCPITGTEKQEFSDTSRQLEKVSSCVQKLGTSATEKIGEPQEIVTNKVEQERTKEVGLSAVLCGSIEKQGDEIAVSFIKDDNEAVHENHDKPCSKLPGSISSLPDSHNELHETGGCPANPTNITCGPSITCGSPLETDKDENQVKPTANLNPPISESINKDSTNLSSDHDCKENDVSKGNKSLTPEVNPVAKFSKEDITDLTTKGTGTDKRQPVPVAAANKESTVVEESPLASGLGTPKINTAGNISSGSPQISDGNLARSTPKGTPERKPRRASNKTAGKDTSRKGSKAKTPVRQPEKGDRSNSLSLSPSPGFQLMQSNEVQHIHSISAKPFALLNASTSSLPDLNTSVSPPVLFQQPFLDIQQVQLRAQIFVYGALIQSTVPDEACMISAFGGPDGGRSMWEKSWSLCMERQRGQKSHTINPETPIQSRSGSRTPNSAVKHSALLGKSISSPLGLASSKVTPTIVNPLTPLSSPLWSLPTPSGDSLQSTALARSSAVDYSPAPTSLHSYQTPPVRNFLGHNTSWMSQAPFRGPWPASPVTDTNKFSSVKASSVPPSSSIKNVPPGLPGSSAVLQSVQVATSPSLDTNNVAVSHAQHSSVPKPKKRKKVLVSEDLGPKAMHLQSQIVMTPVVSSHIYTAVPTATPVGNVPITTVEKSVVSVSPVPLADHLKSDLSVEKRIMSEESLTKVMEARISAEEASALSAAAVNHSLEIWKQLDKQKNSGLVSDIEAKLASAAVAVAAAAAVAKAAAAAANVASNAALQAKLMADEALVLSGCESSCQISLSEGMSNLGKATPASILKGANGTNSSSSIISAAKEASRRGVEAASAARKRAENMDAIVKAAELAAEAVSQAGKIVTMGDPLQLSELVEAGPEGRWKAAAQESSQQVGILRGVAGGLMNIHNVGDRLETYHVCNRDISSKEMGKQIAASEKSPFHVVHKDISHDHMRSIDGISSVTNINEKSSIGPKGRKISDLVNPIDVLPQSETEIHASSAVGDGSENLEENKIKEGSLVEVFKDGEGFKAAWFAASILSLKDGKAYVCYSVLVADEGAGPLKEWVSLEGEGDKPPRIRVARPRSGFHSEGVRKRRRAAMVDYTWSVGDRVDAWIQESWQEGVITDKNKKDKTLTVHFPARDESSVVRAWQLRPTLIWQDGNWIESPKAGANDSPTNEGDTPREKRPKLGNPEVDLVKGKDKISDGQALESANPIESKLLNLSENDKVFNIGKNSKNQNKSGLPRMGRTGPQKEGPRVIFGVPKPGKKRKFMDVSKQYVTDGTNKANDGNDSVKLANFLIPQGSGSRGWKNSSKIDTKEKLGTNSRATFTSGRTQSILGRAIPPREKPSINSHTNDLTSRSERIKDSSSHFKNASQSENQVERATYSGNTGAGAGPILYGSSTDSHPTKRTSTLRASKGKLAPAGGRAGKVEVEKTDGNSAKSTSDVMEPRRSNRKIQPTSRLLEGLQSSLIISKIPSGSHDKVHKNQNRNTSKGNNHD